MKLLPPQRGFSLLEVMIALTLFGVFVSTFLVTQGYNVSDSALNEEQLKLHLLCDSKMQETLINPPRFTNALVDTKEVKTFEDKEYSNYTYTVEWKKLKVPDFGKIFAANAAGGSSEEGGNYFDENQRGNRNNSVEKLVFDRLKENIERAVWQLRLTVTNKETNYSYTLSRWITNYDEPIQLNLSF